MTSYLTDARSVCFMIKKSRCGTVFGCLQMSLSRLPGRHPAIVHRTPYESTAGEYIEWGVWWAQHGYAAIVQDVRGRSESEGVFYPRGPGAGEDGYDTLEWLASQPWCSGRVGTWGRSAGASVQWSLASLEARTLYAWPRTSLVMTPTRTCTTLEVLFNSICL